MTPKETEQLCLSLINCTEGKEVLDLLKKHELWNKDELWRPYGVPENPEITYRNNGWKSFNDWLGIRTIKKSKRRRKKKKTKAKNTSRKLKPLNSVKNYKFSKLASKRLPRALNAVKLVGNLSRRSSYKYTDEEAQAIIKSLSKAMRDLRKKFK